MEWNPQPAGHLISESVNLGEMWQQRSNCKWSMFINTFFAIKMSTEADLKGGCIWMPSLTYTLTGQFIRYTMLVSGWTPFCLPNSLNFSGHRLNKVLETFLRYFGPYWHDSITQLLQICRLHMWISRSTTSQRCSIGLRSGDCGGHLSKLNSLSCSRNQSEMIWAWWHGALSCWK